MSKGKASLLAWGMFVLAVVLLVLSQVIIGLPHPRPLNIETSGNSPFAAFGLFAFSIVGALIVSRRPTHPIGWIYCASGFMVGLTAFSTAYTQYAAQVPGVLPAGGMVDIIANISFPLAFLLPITFGFLLFPDGHLPSPRWRLIAWLTALAFALSFVGFGIVLLLFLLIACAASLVMRWRRARGEERQQLKWIGSAAAMVAIVLPLDIAASILIPGWNSTWGFWVMTSAYALIPIAAGIAILKYRLYEIDIIINRTLVYVPLTAILAGLFAATITLSQKLFIAVTGQSSDAAAVLTTLVVVAAFEPLKKWLQEKVDKRFKDVSDPTKKLVTFGDQVQSDYGTISPHRMARRLLNEVALAYDVTGGAVYLGTNSQEQLVYSRGKQNGKPELSLQIESDGLRFGHLDLGPRQSGANYSAADRAALEHLVTVVAAAMEEDAK